MSILNKMYWRHPPQCLLQRFLVRPGVSNTQLTFQDKNIISCMDFDFNLSQLSTPTEIRYFLWAVHSLWHVLSIFIFSPPSHSASPTWWSHIMHMHEGCGGSTGIVTLLGILLLKKPYLLYIWLACLSLLTQNSCKSLRKTPNPSLGRIIMIDFTDKKEKKPTKWQRKYKKPQSNLPKKSKIETCRTFYALTIG